MKNNEVCRHRWEDNIKMYLQVIGFGQGGVHGLDLSGSGQG